LLNNWKREEVEEVEKARGKLSVKWECHTLNFIRRNTNIFGFEYLESKAGCEGGKVLGSEEFK
jgi:hypothetical protein